MDNSMKGPETADIEVAETMDESGANQERKRPRYTDNINDRDKPREIFISNIPYDVSQSGLETALKRLFGQLPGFDGIRKIILNRGFAFVAFKTHDEALDAINSTRDHKMGPRKLNIQLSVPFGARRPAREEEGQSTGSSSTPWPNPDCWFCVASPLFEKHLILSMDESASCYTLLSKGQVTKGHVLVCPVTHYGCYAAADESIRRLCDEQVEKMRCIHRRDGLKTVVFERWIPLPGSTANHMQVHVVPIPKGNDDVDWRKRLLDAGSKAGVEFLPVRDHEEVIEKMNGILSRVSYLFVSIPRFGSDEEVDNYLGIGKLGFTFPREYVCDALGTPEKVDWKMCQLEKEMETDQLASMREAICNISE